MRLQSALPTTVNGVFSSAATLLTMSGMTVTGAVVNGNGGGLASTGPGGSNVTLDDMVFTGNTANIGGGVYLNNSTTLTIRNTIIRGNTALYGGGLAFFSDGSLVMDDCTIADNVATNTTSAGGGGFYFFGAARPTPPAGYVANQLVIRGSTFSNNRTSRVGGAIHVETFAGTLRLQDSTISGNTAAVSGGGIAGTMTTNATIALQNTTVTNNSVGADQRVHRRGRRRLQRHIRAQPDPRELDRVRQQRERRIRHPHQRLYHDHRQLQRDRHVSRLHAQPGQPRITSRTAQTCCSRRSRTTAAER
ncbi:MAG: right-handed parallel beta-helix repeat-containing protein [Paludibacteraceae bacterium]